MPFPRLSQMRTLVNPYLVAGMALLAGCRIAWAFSGGPPASYTGALALGSAPAEPTCVHCHIGNPINDPAGRVEILGAPATFTPGARCTLTVQMSYAPASGPSGYHAWGFQLTAIDSATGVTLGRFELPAGLQIRPAEDTSPYVGRMYVEHSPTSLHLSKPSPVGWTLAWIAPETASSVIYFFAAANAADGAGTPHQDHIFTTQAVSRPLQPPVSVPPTIVPALEALTAFPNPSYRSFTLSYTITTATWVDLSLHDVAGRSIRHLLSSLHAPGRYQLRWDGTTNFGVALPAATYYALLRTPSHYQLVIPVTLLR